MTATIPELTRTERLALTKLLDGLTDEEWTSRSLCTDWRVCDVAAHVAWAPVAGVAESAVGMLRAAFRPNRFIADSAVRWSGRGRDATMAQLRDNAHSGAAPMGMPAEAALTDAVVHAAPMS